MLRESQEFLNNQILRRTGSNKVQEVLGTSRRYTSDDHHQYIYIYKSWESLNDLMGKVGIEDQRDKEINKLTFRGTLESSRAVIQLRSERIINQMADLLVTNAFVCEMLEV